MDRSLLKCAIKTWSILRNYTSLTSRASCQRIIPQEHSLITENTNTNEKDYDDARISKDSFLQSEFRSAKSFPEILGLLQDKKYKLDITEALAATRKIYNLVKKKDSRPEPPIGSRKEFMELCEVMQKNISLINANEAIDLLSSLSHPNIGVPITSSICQSLFKIISCNIHDLSLNRITFLQFLLKKQKKSVLSQALEISLPVVFEAKWRQQLPEVSFPELISAFVYAVDNKLPDSSIDYIIEMIHTRMGEFNGSDAKLLSIGLIRTNIRSMAFKKILKQFFELVANRANEISFEDMRMVFCDICYESEKKYEPLRFRVRKKEYYNANVIEAFVRRVIEEDWGFNVAMKTLQRLNMILYSQIQILDYLAAKCFEDSNIIASCQYKEIYTLLKGFCISNYKPIFWEVIQDMILKHSLWKTSKYDEIVYIAYKLEALGCQHHKPLFKVFKKIKSDKRLVLCEIMMLHRNTKSLNPSYAGPLLDDDTYYSMLMQFNKERLDFPYRTALETALSGPQYVLTNVSSRYKKIIDHVIVMREGGYPVAINLPKDDENTAPQKYLEDMTFPLDSQVILIVDFPSYAYPLNSSKMRAEWSRTIKVLEGALYRIVPLCWELNMRDMSERQKILYLMQAIKLKCEETVTDS